jgi:type IX secretion system PorP/SprF family membrane protein
MKKSIKILVLALVSSLAGKQGKAQTDPHFSQYYMYPSWLNPALTGAFDGDYRVSGIYRSQWGNVSPFITPGLAVDFNTDKNVNLGASILRQTVKDGGYTYTTAYGNFAYTGVRWGKQEYNRLVFGLQAGLIERRFDPSKLTFGDQWNPVTGYNPGSSAEVLSRTSTSSFDAGAGVLYFDATPGKKANFYGGFSVSHLTRPSDQFSASGDARIPVRYTVHGGIKLQLSDVVSLTPNVLYLKQGTAQEKMVGAYAQMKAAPETDLLLGANYRFDDAISPYLGFTYKNMLLGASYDVNTSDLARMTGHANSFEISLSFTGRKKAKTTEVEFVCPRL